MKQKAGGNKGKQDPEPAGGPVADARGSGPLADARGSESALLSATATKLSASLGIVLAMVLATIVNVLVSRHYRRWDVTRGGLYTLSDATLTTLHDLPETVRVYVLLPAHEPLTLSVQHLLDGYRAETSRLEIESVDPVLRPAEFLALAQKFGIGTDSDDGHVVASVAAVITRGDRRELLRQDQLVEVDAEDDLRRRPRLEQAFTGAIRAVSSGDHAQACFTTGHGEDESGPLKQHLNRNGYEVVVIPPARAGEKVALDGCKLLVVAGPQEKVPADDVTRWTAYLDKGGTALVAAGPVADPADMGFVDLGLDPLLKGFGVTLDRDFVFELDPRLRAPAGRGETFTPLPRSHPATLRLVKLAERGVVPVMTVASSFTTTGAGVAAVTPLLVTSDAAFGMVDFKSMASGAPAIPGAADRKGPLTVAVAAERPGPAGHHTGRLVAVGSSGAVAGANWQRDREDLRGTALFVESAIAWLTERPPILDIPQKPAFTAGLRVSEDWLDATRRYVLLYMPLAAMLVGVAVYLRRRGEKRGPTARGSE